MKKIFYFLLCVVCVTSSLYSQTATIDVAENTFKVGVLGGKEEFYYGFLEGDQVVFNFTELNGKELNEVEIIEFPSSSKFMDYKTKRIENKVLNIQNTGVYKFVFSNSSLSSRVCRMKIQRIPATETTRNFNTTVYWRTVKDTTFLPSLERYLVKSDTIAQEIYSAVPKISSQNAYNGNKNYQIVDFTLPENTVSWSFYIGTGSEGKAEYDRALASYSLKAAKIVSGIPGYGPLAALALTGVSYFKQVQGESNVKYWFLSNAESVANFYANQTFYSYKKGDVITEASQMKSPLNGKVYVALLNDNTVYAISVTIKVVAIQLIQEWRVRTKQEMIITNKQIPYLRF